MKVFYSERFKKSYRKLDTKLKAKFAKQLDFLLTNPRHPSLQIHPVQGAHDIFEARLDLQYRFTFTKESSAYILRVIGNHDEVLKNP